MKYLIILILCLSCKSSELAEKVLGQDSICHTVGSVSESVFRCIKGTTTYLCIDYGDACNRKVRCAPVPEDSLDILGM